MRSTVGILLVIVGIVLFVMGYNRQHSLAGHAADVGTSVANSVDGGARTPEHTTYMVIGGILVVVGIGVAATGRGVRP